MKLKEFSLIIVPNKVQNAVCGAYFKVVQDGPRARVVCEDRGAEAEPCKWQFTKVGDELPKGMGTLHELFNVGGRRYTLSSTCIA